ncbi:MAG: hypothetical protein IMY87_00280 [Chloroflexi bacterium]|nr:hypothetical protein [Chloroflexota bacterium]
MEWETIVAAVGGALIGAALGGFFRDWIAEKYFRPKLYILDESLVSGIGFVQHRILVRNRGRRAAQNCIGMITLDATVKDVSDSQTFSVYDPQPILTENNFTPIEGMPLCWSSLENPEAIVINRDTTQVLELYKASGGARIRIPTEKGWNPYRVGLYGNDYLGEIRVTSANADPAWASFRLKPEVDDVKLEIIERKPGLDEQRWHKRAQATLRRRLNWKNRQECEKGGRKDAGT